MAIIRIEDIFQYLQPSQTIAGLDLGTKTIGLAVSDLSWSLANPRPYIQREKFTKDVAKLHQIFIAEKVGVAVLGLPINMDGSMGERAQASKAFAYNIQTVIKTPIILWDERLSTVAAERALIDHDMSRKKRKSHIDSAAATFILQGALDRISWLAEPSQGS